MGIGATKGWAVGRDFMSEPVSYGSFTDGFVDDLASRMRGLRVLEVFAGNGLLASKLAARGVDVVATTVFSSHDGHHLGLLHPVFPMDARLAVEAYGPGADVLLMSWPTTDQAAWGAAMRWGPERPMVYIGEAPLPDLPFGGYPGCASDLFFEATEVVEPVASYVSRNIMDTASVRRARPSYVAAWREAVAMRAAAGARGPAGP